jgi:sialic acid synthase SpsE/sugar phosphate isomerase/epimerase
MSRRPGYVRIGERLIGPDEPCFVIAEVGVNHNGDLNRAKALVDAAIDAGVDAVKFQKRKLADVYQQRVLDEPRRGEQGLQYIVPLLVEFELSDDEFSDLAAYCRQRQVTFLCTPWDASSVDFLMAIDIPAFKIGSPDMTNFPLIECVARTGKPLLMSTGMSTEEEIRRTLAFVKARDLEVGLFHCVSTYPVSPDEINLRFMQKLHEWSGGPVGYSGHEEGIAISLSAVAMGARILERHITLDRTMRGPDHKASLEPDAFRTLVETVREVESSLGVPHRWLSRGEVLNRRVLGKSLVAAADLPAGTVLRADLIATKSPGWGLSPQRIDDLVGRRLVRAVGRDDLFSEADLAGGVSAHSRRGVDVGLRWGVPVRFSDMDPLVRRFSPQGMSLLEMHLSDRDLDAGIDAFHPAPLPFELIVHAPEYCHDHLIDLCAADDEQRLMSIGRIQKTIDLTLQLAGFFDPASPRGPKIIVHAGGMSRGDAGYDLRAAGDRLIASLRALNTDGVDLLLENLPPCPWFFGGRWAGHMLVDAANTAAMCAESGLGLCFDTSHAALACHQSGESLIEFARLVQPYVRHLHLSDGAGMSGEGLQIGEGDVSFLDLWPILTSPAATCIPEIWMGHHDEGSGFQTALDRLTEIVWATRALSFVRADAARSEMAKMVVPVTSTVAAALRTIDANTLGIVFVVDDRGSIAGVATDGDVRRALLRGASLDDLISEVMNRDFVFARSDASLQSVDSQLSFRCRVLPILDPARRLVDYRALPVLFEGIQHQADVDS